MLDNKIIKSLFYLYFLVLFLVVVLKFGYAGNNFRIAFSYIDSIKESRKAGFWNINLYPFKTIKSYITNILEGYKTTKTLELYFILNLVGNMFAFIPLGFFIPKVFNLNFFKSILCCIFIITFFELIEFIFMIGFFDVDDIILNAFGCMIGYLLHKIVDLEKYSKILLSMIHKK